MLSTLENKVLDKLPVDEKSEPAFTVKNIGYGQLVEIETDLRNRLSMMYAKCHENYQRGIVALYKALKE